ncbi:hypothetical protein [Deinococcus arenicola]|uniref:Uncharacterized protein n=1 Tax=Deinococcus arenicola TaxID=2994950 RepID=A0ABU4DRJ3_9DEIO|nr:hypothetical protein [Deinococcus sp. ZS9-10]MDV6375042.1 hypothetical protein [Deinococcus sp. ZS9-10]
MTKNPDDAKPQGGLPDDLGNGMSDRSGYQGESETGMTDTPIGRKRPLPKAVPDHPKDTDNSGTTFDADTGTGREL